MIELRIPEDPEILKAVANYLFKKAGEMTIKVTWVETPPPEVEESSAQVTNLDINELLWDERIHASSQAKNADGSWRMKRGVDSTFVASVIAELKGEVSPPEMTFPELLMEITRQQSAQRINLIQINQIMQGLNLTGLPDLNSRPDLINEALKRMRAIWG